MREKIRRVFQDLSSGKLSEEGALERIKAIKQSASTEGTRTLLSVPIWEQRTPESYSEADQSEYEEHCIILCGIPHIMENHVESLIACSRCVSFLSTQRNIAERYNEAALYCFTQVATLLRGKPKGKILVQIFIVDHSDKDLYLGLSGLLKTASLENPLISGQVILTDARIDVEELVRQSKESMAAATEQIVKYKHSTRYVLCLRQLEQNHFKPKIGFKDNGVYLITGGLGGLGILFVKEILKQTSKAKVILVGRTGLTTDKRILLDQIASGNRTILYKQLDVEKFDQVNHLISSIKEEHNQLNGILHCAGIIADNFILKKTPAEFKSVLSPKVHGTVNLDEASKGIDLDFMVLFSSVASTFGNLGQADYACANGFMDQYALYRNKLLAANQRRGITVSVNWPLWQEGAMHLDQSLKERMQDATGIYPLQTSNGMQAFHQALALQIEQALVTEGDLRKMCYALYDRQSIQPASFMDQVKPMAAKQLSVPEFDRNSNLNEQTQEYLRKQFATVLKLPTHKIDIHAPLERYGIDSILALNLTSHLEETFGTLSKTLFFEYQTIHELAGYFTRIYSEQLESLLAAPDAVRNHVRSDGSSVKTRQEPDAKRVARRRFNRQGQTISEGERHLGDTNDTVAVVGISGRYPEADNIQEYWQNLRDGRDCITEVPKERWDWREFYDEDRGKTGHHYSKWGGFISGVDEFDPRFFNISPREAESIDPQERLFLQHAWMAIEDAGYTRAGLQIPQENDQPGQVGVYVGVMYGEYNVSGSLASIANRVSYVLNLHGPSITLDTMCSSSLTAIHLACQDLKLGRTNLAIAGGVNVSIHPSKYSMLSAGQFISGDGHCQSFGEGGNGYIPGEGVGVVVLKRLSEAERDGDHIYGIVRGSVINHGGKTNGYTVPNPQAQASAISRALSETNTNPRHVSYIEAHGTGTKLGDPIEIAALTKSFQQHTQDTGFCLIGSAKSNIGHCESAAGIAGVTKVLLQMKYKQIVPSLHSERLNPNIDFKKTPFVVNQKLTTWEQPMIDGVRAPRIAGISSFGAGGSNAHIILQEYVKHIPVERTLDGHVSHPGVVVPLSARTVGQLKQKAKSLLEFIELSRADEGVPDKRTIDLYALAYTLQVGREAMEERIGFLINSQPQLEKNLRAYINDQDIEDFYQGQVKSNTDTVSEFTTDADLQQTLNKWIVENKLSKLLGWWVKGLDLDWNKLYREGKPPRLSLPAYPFARERYWIDPVTKSQKVTVSQVPGAMIHPLVHENTSDLQLHSYSSNFSGDEFFVKDYQVNCDAVNVQRILPIVAGLEMARVAVERAMPARSKESILELHNVIWAEPIVIDGGKKVSIALFAINAHQTDFEIYGLANGEDIVYCQGHAIVNPIPVSGKLDIYKLKEEMNAGKIEPIEFYTLLTSMGLNYGANYQVISSVNRGNNQFLAQLQLPGVLENTKEGWVLHPGIMEGIMQTSLGLIMYSDQRAGLPLSVTLDSMNIISACTKNMYVWARYRPNVKQENNIIKLDVDLCDAEGNICVQLKGISFRQEYVKQLQDKPEPAKLKQASIATANVKVKPAQILLDSPARSVAMSKSNGSRVTAAQAPVIIRQAFLEKPVISLSGL